MAYQTGTVATPEGLISALASFAQANGWAYSGSMLSKGGCYVSVNLSGTTAISIAGSRNGTFVAPDLCPRTSYLRLDPWPTTLVYHFIAFQNPDTIWVTVNWDVTSFAHMGLGTIQKYGDWAGGMWFHGQHAAGSNDKNTEVYMVKGGPNAPYFLSSAKCCGLFWSQRDYSVWGDPSASKVSFVHCELRGEVWPATNGNGNDETDLNIIHCPTVLAPSHYYTPNVYNGQTIITPFELYLQNTDGHYMSIGHVGHLRFVDMLNYNPGDILQIGSDRWKLFPWAKIDPRYPDGRNVDSNNGAFGTGYLGVAVRYDGV